jgi:hypothetical protein
LAAVNRLATGAAVIKLGMFQGCGREARWCRQTAYSA